MEPTAQGTIFFVDDEEGIRTIVKTIFEGAGFSVECFPTARHCLERLPDAPCDVVVTDVKMPGMTGMDLLREVRQTYPWLAVLITTGYGDVPMAVKAMEQGACGFLEKPLDRDTLLAAVAKALERSRAFQNRPAQGLTKMEAKVIRLVVEGKSSREIGDILKRSARTIEVHRSRAMRKLGTHNLVELVREAQKLGLFRD